jgi:hypothetical protein
MQPKGRSAVTTSLPSPIGGWNARDSLANMQQTDAVQLVNFYATPTDVTLRKGYTKSSTGITGRVKTLMNYNDTSLDAGYRLFAAAGDTIYDAKPATAVPFFSGISDPQLQHVTITNQAGHFLVACNGVDPVMIFNGTYWYYLATTETAQTISTISHLDEVALLTTASAHGLVTGNRVVISGASPAEYNGDYVIEVISSTQFQYTMASTPATDATSVGTYTVSGITGVDSSTFINVNLFKNRLYFTQKDALTAWYLNVDAISGAASPLYYGGIARNGGYLQAIGTWTLDAGQGVDDYYVAVTSMGEVIVFNGTDPDSAETWALKGVWQIGQTFSRRCFFKWSGDLLLLTQDGLVPLSAALQSSRLDPRVNLTDKIYYAISQAATQNYALEGWQINYFASENMLILSIPTGNGMEQYVMNTITKSWSRFTNIQAYCWEVSGDADMHFGGDGFVGEFYESTSDAGTNIYATAQQAYSYFNSPGQLKRFTLVRPILQTDNGVPTVLCGISVDFDTEPLINQIAFNPLINQIGRWDAATWDGANWGGGLVTTKIWQGVTGLGFAGSVNINVASQGIELHWASTDYVMENGGVL